jgi:hypothetical protein
MPDFPEVKLEIFAPEDSVESISQALHEAGAGRIGKYDHCLSITRVTGSWRPLPGANPYDGEVGKISRGSECKIEVNCQAENVKAAIQAVRAVHPYEEPLINVVPLVNYLYK